MMPNPAVQRPLIAVVAHIGMFGFSDADEAVRAAQHGLE
jgi:hypothetical protein